VPTGEILAFIAKPNLPFAQQFAFSFHIGAVLPPGKAASTVTLTKSLLFQIIFHRQITYAEGAVHSARGN
jgi:hypothetical protein